MKLLHVAGGLALAVGLGTAAQADKLDDVIGSGTLRCAVVPRPTASASPPATCSSFILILPLSSYRR